MSYATSKKHERARKERRAQAREQEKLERRRRAARRRRRRVLLRVGLPLAGVATAAGVLLVVQSRSRAAAVAAQVGPANMLSDGVVLSGDGSTMTATRTAALQPDAEPQATVADPSTGVLDIVLYTDYRSADAATFWTANSSNLESWVTAGQATLEIHPLALGGDDYALRAAGALGCVADTAPDSVFAVHAALETAQPDLDEDGLDTAGLESLVSGVGADATEVTDCLEAGDFTDWAAEATARAAAEVPFDAVGTVTTAPVVVVAGQQYTGDLADADAFTAFLSDVFEQVAADSAAATDDGTAATAAPTEAATTATTEGTGG